MLLWAFGCMAGAVAGETVKEPGKPADNTNPVSCEEELVWGFRFTLDLGVVKIEADISCDWNECSMYCNNYANGDVMDCDISAPGIVQQTGDPEVTTVQAIAEYVEDLRGLERGSLDKLRVYKSTIIQNEKGIFKVIEGEYAIDKSVTGWRLPVSVVKLNL